MKNASFQIEEDCPTFRPFTRESLAKIEARLEEVNEKKRELEKKRAEGEVNIVIYFGTVIIRYIELYFSINYINLHQKEKIKKCLIVLYNE